MCRIGVMAGMEVSFVVDVRLANLSVPCPQLFKGVFSFLLELAVRSLFFVRSGAFLVVS